MSQKEVTTVKLGPKNEPPSQHGPLGAPESTESASRLQLPPQRRLPATRTIRIIDRLPCSTNHRETPLFDGNALPYTEQNALPCLYPV